ncbi:MAG TPA: glycosyltransferase family 39 protein [Candidatus Micrarchaeaceae archaeon]|nr:glycosyltransferase family 39 protein [Candidatus Micrarchaeaceae archaeon]
MHEAVPRAVSMRLPVWLTSEAFVITVLALIKLTLHLATNGLYDFHRDSLYYLDSARHPAWGYVDYPPITPMVARLSLWLFGPSVWGLRLWPSLAGTVMVVLAALIARELGGGRFARILAAVGALTSPVLLGANWLFQTVTFDELTWLVSFWLAARLVRTQDRRLWLVLGVTLGVGLETKYTIVALIAGLAIGTLLTPLRRHLATPWPWLGLGLTLLIFLPNLLWQVANAWPSVEYTLNHKSAQSVDFSPVTFLTEQLALIGPLAIPLWLGGLYWLLSGPGRRLLGIAALVPFVVYLFVGKSYYIGPLDPLLLAAGSCGLETWTRRRVKWLRPATVVALVAQALVLLPLALPLLPEATMARSPLPGIRKDFADTVGWHDLVAQVAAVYDALPAGERPDAVILTNNYGEAGAINTFGGRVGLPTAVSGELTYYYWKPTQLDGPVIVVGLDPSFLVTLFSACSPVGTVSNSYGLHNEEFGAPISVCRQPRMPLDQLWPKLKAFQ